MKIDTESLGESPRHHSFQVEDAWWERQRIEGEAPGRLTGPLRFEVDTHRLGSQIHVEGQLEGAIELECGRCVARYRHALRDSFRFVLDAAGERVPADPEEARALERNGVCLGEEFETGLYRGPEIDLDAFFGEFVSLALPLQPRCRDQCRGLCPSCGSDRNETECNCGDQQAKSPFAALAALKTESSD